jgi:hypothetical protein
MFVPVYLVWFVGDALVGGLTGFWVFKSLQGSDLGFSPW